MVGPLARVWRHRHRNQPLHSALLALFGDPSRGGTCVLWSPWEGKAQVHIQGGMFLQVGLGVSQATSVSDAAQVPGVFGGAP